TLFAWAPRGQQVYGECSSQRRPRQNLLEARLKDRAKVFGVHPSAIGHALKRLHITVKKNSCAIASVTIDNDRFS
ncbi:MAG: IS630 transposase-related protein, partial [Cyanobacteria bacterium J06639_1]